MPHLHDLIPYEQIEPHIKHGFLAESIFRKRLQREGLVYENLTLLNSKPENLPGLARISGDGILQSRQ